MTDKEIITALDFCSDDEAAYNLYPYHPHKPQFVDLCIAFDERIQRIKELEAEVERLQGHNLRMARKHYDDGVREFAERLKERSEWHSCGECSFEYVYFDDIDYLVKEMTEDTSNDGK